MKLLPGRKRASRSKQKPLDPPLPGGLNPANLNDYIVALFKQGWGPMTIRPSTTDGGTRGYTVDSRMTTHLDETWNAHIFGRTPAEAFYSLGRHIGRHFSDNPLGESEEQREAALRTIKILQREVGVAQATAAMFERLMRELVDRHGDETVRALAQTALETAAELRADRGLPGPTGAIVPPTANRSSSARRLSLPG